MNYTTILRFALFIGFLIVFCSAGLAGTTFAAPEAVSVEGLREPVTVRRDGRSVPYIEAKNDADLYFAQGYETARDRLWQMDLFRRVARGRVAELFGRSVLQEDMRWRRFGFAEIAEEGLKSMEPGLKKALEDYTRGVNAYIDSLEKKDLPIEFRILQYEPEPWHPTDTIVIGKILADALSTTWMNDIGRMNIEKLPEAHRAELLDVTDPLDVVLFGKDIPAEVRGKKGKHRLGDRFDLAELQAIAAVEEELRERSLARVGFHSPELAASNNWVISGKRTLDGKAILANDPHLRPAAPGIWYLTHLSAPGVRVSGVTFPGVPGIVLGHNEKIAWGATNVGPDVQDVYFEEFNEEGQYRTPHGWKKPVKRTEIIKVRKGLLGPETVSETLEVLETGNGPVIGESGGRKFTLKWTARDPENQEFESFFLLNRAADWKDFKRSLSRYGGAMQNFVYADTDGNIGWYAAGKVPIRRKGGGELPYDGATADGDWIGDIPFEDLPNLYNPPEGFIVTANQRIAGTSYKYQQITREYAPPWRARRIYDLINANTKITVNDVSDIQRDVFNFPLSEIAREVVRRGAASSETTDLLKGWDGKMVPDSRPAVIADEMRNCLAREMASANPPAPYGAVRERVLHRALAANDKKWLPEKYASYDDLMRTCDARQRAIASLGGPGEGNGESVKWGAYRKASFNHPLSAAPLIGGRFRLSFANVAGSGQTPNVGAYVSMRHIAVPGKWDETRQWLPLGQSGDPDSPHWKDQFESWRTGTPAIFPFSAKAAEASAKSVVVLEPGK